MHHGQDSFDAPSVYYAELSRHSGQWLGHPLWYPDPDETGEVQIGDVGYVFEGRFKRLFNTVNEEGFNDSARPQGFKRLSFDEKRLGDSRGSLKPGPLASASVKIIEVEGEVEAAVAGAAVSVGCTFQCSSQQGAILHLKDHAQGLCMVPNKLFPNYMKQHHASWVQYVENELGLTIQHEDLILVRGWVKTSEWAVAAFKSSARATGASINASFNSIPSAGFDFKVSRRNDMMDASNAGPRRIQSVPTPASSTTTLSSPSPNQCIFLRYYKIKYRRFFLPNKIAAAAGPDELPDGPPEGHSYAARVDEDMQVEIEASDSHERPLVPLDALLEYILEYSNADAAIACEGDLEELFWGDTIPDDISNYLRIHRPLIDVGEDKVGMLSIESLLLGRQRLRRIQAQQGVVDDEEVESFKRNAGAAQGPVEKVVLAGGRSLQWLDIVLKDPEAEGVAVNSFSISKNGERVLTSSDNSVIKLWDLRTGEDLNDFIGHEDSVLAVAFSPDGTRFVSGSADSEAMIWDIDGAQRIATLSGHSAWVWCVAYAPDNQTIATGSFDQTVRLWDPDGTARFTLETHAGQVTLLEFAPDGACVLAGADAVAHLWDCRTGRPRAALRGHGATIWAARFARAGDRVATGADDGTARVWDARTGDELVTLREHTGPVWAVDFSADGRAVASGSCDASLAACDSFSGESLFAVRERPARVHALAYSCDGKYIVSGDADGLVKLWDAASGAFVAEFQGHQDKVKAVAWSPDDKAVVSSSDDGSVRVWSVRDLMRLQ